MSTKISTDMNVTRSTTRRLAPPGGGTSIALTSDDSTAATANGGVAFGARTDKPKPVAVRPHDSAGPSSIVIGGGLPVKSEYAEPAPKPKTTTDVDVKPTDQAMATQAAEFKVGLAIEGLNLDESKIAQAFANLGVPMDSITVSSSSQITAAIMQLSKVGNVDVVVAVHTTARNGFHSNVIAMSAALGVPCVFGEEGVSQPASVLDDVVALMSYSASKKITGKMRNDVSNATASVSAATTKAAAAKAAPQPLEMKDNIEVMLNQLRESAKQRGAFGISGLARKFRIVDDNGNGQLELDEFTKAIHEHSIEWSPEEIKLVFDAFDKEGDGAVSYDEFLVTIRGPMNKRREQMVLMAFDVMDKDKSGILDYDDVAGVYNAKLHPDVINGKKTEKEILDAFLEGFEGGSSEHDGKVTPSEWIDHYSNISASIDDDDYFELMIRNAWHISGGEGWCENSSNMRVLVTHSDGSQTVEEVKNDIGIKSDDKAQITARLQAQGVDVKGFETSGVVDSTEPPKTPSRTPRGQVMKSSVVLG